MNLIIIILLLLGTSVFAQHHTIKNDTLSQISSRSRIINCRNSNIIHINTLPPELYDLNCSFNKLTTLPNLPESLEFLDCSNNLITQIDSLPKNIFRLDCSNNLITRLPSLPQKLGFLNYSNNLIEFDELPCDFKLVNCTKKEQNCLPPKRQKIVLTLFNIKKTVSFDSIQKHINHVEIYLESTAGFGVNCYQKFYYRYSYDSIDNNYRLRRQKKKTCNDTSYYHSYNEKVDQKALSSILENIVNNVLEIDNNTFKVDLNNDKTIHLNSFSYTNMNYYQFYGSTAPFPKISIKIYYEDKMLTLKSKVARLPGYEEEYERTSNVNYLLVAEWLYMYQLMNLFFADNFYYNSHIYNQKNLNGLFEFYMKNQLTH